MSVSDRVRFMQQSDVTTKNINQLIQEGGKLTEHGKSVLESYKLCDGLLYRQFNGKSLLVVPKPMRKGIIIAAHDYGGHFSVDRTIAKITKNYWFSGLKRYVVQHVRMCLVCLVHKRPVGEKSGLLHPIPPGRRPFETIHVDHLGPFQTSTLKNRLLIKTHV